MSVFVDFNRPLRAIKPLHGFNNAARDTGYGELLPAFAALKPPFIRLHDTGFNACLSKYVDVHNIFPDPSADEEDERSYDFLLTDRYIEKLVEAGAQVIYRFGTTIEHEPKKYYIGPPDDFAKYARVCEHIVRHYNDGWADGFRFGIKYWEIWNEPDGGPDCAQYGAPCWGGTPEQFYELYRLVSREVKGRHPGVKVGGYSSCFITGSFHKDRGCWLPDDAKFLNGFLKYITAPETRSPLDFFTWHGYLGENDMSKIERESAFVDETLRRYGFGDEVERFDTEWSCIIRGGQPVKGQEEVYLNMRSARAAANYAAAMYTMQNCRVDGACFYDAQLGVHYGPLFDFPSNLPTPAYYAFAQFGRLYGLGTQVESSCADGGVYTLAAAGGDEKLLAAANIGDRPVSLEIRASGADARTVKVFLCGDERGLRRVMTLDFSQNVRFTLPAGTFATFEFAQ